MASLTVRNLDENLKHRLRVRAARNGRSMEDELREILRTTLANEDDCPSNLAEAVRSRFAALGGVDLEFPPREPMREAPDFG